MPNMECPTFNPEEELDKPIDAPLSPENKKMPEANTEKSKKSKSENPYLRSIRKGAEANVKTKGNIIDTKA